MTLVAPMALNLTSIRRDIRRTAALLNTKPPEGLDIFFHTKQTAPQDVRYPTLSFTKYADTIAPPQPRNQQHSGIHKIPGIGTYKTGAKVLQNQNISSRTEQSDTRREISDIRRHEIPKNHNTPTNDREFTWDKEQKRALNEEKKLRKEQRNFAKVSKSHDGVVNRSDIDSFDYKKIGVGTSNKKPVQKDNFFLPKVSDNHGQGQSQNQVIEPRNHTSEKQRTLRKLGELSTPFSKSKEQLPVENINPDIVRLGFKEALTPRNEPKKPNKAKEIRKRKEVGSEQEGHLRYQNGVLQPRKSYKGPKHRGENGTTVVDDDEESEEESEGIGYCCCDPLVIELLHCAECNLKGGRHKKSCSKWQKVTDGFIKCDNCTKLRKYTEEVEHHSHLPKIHDFEELPGAFQDDNTPPPTQEFVRLPSLMKYNTFQKAILASRFVTAAQADASNNLTPERYLARLNEKFDRGDYDWSNDVPDVNEVNTKLQLEETAEIDKDRSEEVIVDEYPSHIIEQNGLTIYPNGAKEAYLKALEAAQMARLNSFINLEHRLSKPFVFSYFDNVPRKRDSSTEVNAYGPEGKPKPFRLKGKNAEMKHIFGKIDTNDYYPGQKKNPIRKKKIKKPIEEVTSSYLATDTFAKGLKTKAKSSSFLFNKKPGRTSNHSHIHKVTSMSLNTHLRE